MIRSLAGSGLLLPGLLSELMAAEDGSARSGDPLAPNPTHFAPKAKRVIFLFMTGGVSHVDTFDPKPVLNSRHDQERRPGQYYKGSGWNFRPYGQSGIEVSDLFPHIGSVIDDVCMIRSMTNINGDHFGATIVFIRAQRRSTGLALAPGSVMAWEPSIRICPRLW